MQISAMDRGSMSQMALAAGSRRKAPLCMYSLNVCRRSANKLLLVAFACLLQLWTYTATVGAATNFQSLSLVERNALSVKSGGIAPRVQSLRGNPTQTQINFEMEQLLGNYHGRRQLVTGLFTKKPLAVKSDRFDPTNKFRHYRGGYDVTSKHYWASVAFTGIYGYAIAVAWLLLGLILSFLLCFRYCQPQRERSKDHHTSNYYWLPRVLVLVLALFAIGCFIGLFVRNKQVVNEATKVKHTIVGAAMIATNAIHNVTSAMARVDAVIENYSIPGWQVLNSTEAKLNEQADLVTAKIDHNARKFTRLINAVEITLILILSLGIFIVVVALVPAFIRLRRLFLVIIVFGWIMTALAWLLFGLLYSLNNVATDTCQALDEYLQTPANTTLDNFLPCANLSTINSAFLTAREGISSIIQEANSTVVTIQEVNNWIGLGNGSVLYVCNQIGGPPDYTYTDTCPAGTLKIADLPQVLAPYVCLDNMTTFTCLKDGRFISSGENTTLYNLSEGAQHLIDTVPMLNKLANCSFVYETIQDVINRRCSPLKSALRDLWIPMLLVSMGLTLLTILWIITNHRNTHQQYMGTVYAQNYSPKGRPI